MKFRLLALLCLFFKPLLGQQPAEPVRSFPAMASKGYLLGEIGALRSFAPISAQKQPASPKLFEKKQYFLGNERQNPGALPLAGDPLVNVAPVTGSGEILPELNFEGLRDVEGTYPPDPGGDIGKDHYVQMVNSINNSWFQVWDKYSGNSVYGPAQTSIIWSQVNATSIGDPVIQYDHEAERWLMMELRQTTSLELLLAVSNDSDPTGGWKAYRIPTFGFPDYPKLYVWPNAYFITANEIAAGNKCAGYALDKAALLAGKSEFGVYRFEMPNFQGIQFQPATGADWEGGPPPPPGSPGYLFRLYDDAWAGGQDHLEYWEAYVDWQQPGLSHIDGPHVLITAPFETRVCFGAAFSTDCLEQPDPTAPRLAAFETNIMYKAPYRNFGDHESVVLNHVSDVSTQTGNGGDAAVRWYELRKIPGNGWQIFQQGVYAPDLATNRFTGTISIDEAGNIGLGYTAVSSSLYPGLYLTGRKKDDPPGQMTLPEYPLAPGQTNHDRNRWGDYSSMTVDPYDGRTFWFTGEYQPSGNANWGTRIGAFRIARDSFDVTPERLTAPVSSPFMSGQQPLTVRLRNTGFNPAENVVLHAYLDGMSFADETLSQSVTPGGYFDHTFIPVLPDLPAGGQYRLRIITQWPADQFLPNDTLDAVVVKRYRNDAALSGAPGWNDPVCGSGTTLGIILTNESEAPLTEARIRWRLNGQSWSTYDWTGVLQHGEHQSIPIDLTNMLDGPNLFEAFCEMPNGQPDQATFNDTLQSAITGNTDGFAFQFEAKTLTGMLIYELRTASDSLVSGGKTDSELLNASFCIDDGQCYRLVLKSGSFIWNGSFILKNVYDSVLVQIQTVGPTEVSYEICAPVRKTIDCGVIALKSPVSGPFLSIGEPVTLHWRNFGRQTLQELRAGYRINGGGWKEQTFTGSFSPGQSTDFTFPDPEDLSVQGASYFFETYITTAGDEIPRNDSVRMEVVNRYQRDLELLSIDRGTACDGTDQALVYLKIRNNGVGVQHRYDIVYTLNGVLQPAVLNNLLFAPPGMESDGLLFISGMTEGMNTLTVWIKNVDDQGPDENPANDQASISFDINAHNRQVHLFLSGDTKPQETTWEILDQQGNVLASGGPLTQSQPYVSTDLCLPSDSCFVLRILDSGGDGMGGTASMTIGIHAVLEFQGTNFGSSIDLSFCAVTACDDLQVSADVQPASGAGMSNGQITAIVTGGNPPFLYLLDQNLVQQQPVFTGLLPGNHELQVQDVLSCEKSIVVFVGTSATQTPEASRRLSIAPNPTAGIAHVSVPAGAGEQEAVCLVYDARGNLVQTTQMHRWGDKLRTSIALDRLPAGMYSLMISGLNRTLTGQVLKK